MNKVVIVTGGSRGIGAATSKLLASQGYRVCINYIRNSQAAKQVVLDITAQGGKAFSYQADASDEKDVELMFKVVKEKFGLVTHLVNNAGVLFKQSSLCDLSADRFKNTLNTNVMSCFLCSREFINQSHSKGAIVNVSSGASKTGSPFEYIDYAASKGAIDTMTKGLSLEVADKGIRVNCVRPGFIETEMHTDGGEPDRVVRLSPQIPLKRGGKPEEVAEAIAWLLSEKTAYITGSFIDIAGGK